MFLSECIEVLEEAKETYGDLEVYHLGIDHGRRTPTLVMFDREGFVVLAGIGKRTNLCDAKSLRLREGLDGL